ncbi:MAG: F0F1 ATP synthase subunit delta [Proteobacteria bacterium]|nr:MAG: F0F1 ATP synthase subunit delta [Pseudomonadota bacterium]
MAETASLARPYVRAIFDIAQPQGELAAWSDQLALIKAVTEDPQVKALEGHPRVSADQLAGLVIGVCGDGIGSQAANLVRLLASNRRLSVCGEIAAQYERRRAEAENTVEAELESATELDETQKRQIAAALEKKLRRSVKLDCTTNPDLLGGAVIRTGDWVYDGSVRAQLANMAAALKA